MDKEKFEREFDEAYFQSIDDSDEETPSLESDDVEDDDVDFDEDDSEFFNDQDIQELDLVELEEVVVQLEQVVDLLVLNNKNKELSRVIKLLQSATRLIDEIISSEDLIE
jgi:hypothetical protein